MDIIEDLTSFVSRSKKPLIVILGPTASGKTGISLNLAKKIKGEIISTDSRQIYKGLEIGSDIILPEDRQGIPHHMLAIKNPDQTLTLREYQEQATKIINEIHERESTPMLVGGTGLYISSIIEGYNVPHIPPNRKLREKLTKEAEEKGHEHVHNILKELDPGSAKKIHPNNLPYIIRAIEINKSAGHNKQDKKSKPNFDTYMLGIKWPREQLYERVNLRVDLQIKRGLIEEVQALLNKGYDLNLPAMTSLGAKELVPYIKGEMSLEEALEILKRNTRRYAKRQMTWFKRYDNVKWLEPSQVEKITNT
ncbi:tRNA (adenosine(37)-N6)-dimethylallyltransferase MiaA [Candidatus Peregrinibacteria bacterium]|nr:tRNA (adenosine(37)-N6)-dimethylallyltransferase MiaA [Candidatus Peregrinibacteria bacterium]